MAIGRVMMCGAAAAALAVLPGCGKRFPFGERLLPESYGPPFGAALKANLPEHPHNPAGEERHAAADAQENRTYGSHAACNAAMRARFARHAAAPHPSGPHAAGGPAGAARSSDHGHAGADNPHGPVQISSIESVGHYRAAGVTHEYRCTNYVLSYRAWRQEGARHAPAAH